MPAPPGQRPVRDACCRERREAARRVRGNPPADPRRASGDRPWLIPYGPRRSPIGPNFSIVRMSQAEISIVQDGLPPGQRGLAMLAVGIAVSISVLVGSIANIALPTIARDMNVTPAESIWVVNAYQLAVTICLMPCASLGDVYGHRRVYIWGLALYTFGSLVCAVAPDMSTLIGARVLQGVGGAGIMSVNGALVRFIFPRAQLGRGVGYNVLVVAASSAAGPSVAAAILALASWPWLFAVQVPVGVVSWWLSLRFLPPSPAVGSQVRSDQRPVERHRSWDIHSRP